MAQVPALTLNSDGDIARVLSGDTIQVSDLGTGTANTTMFLRGDGTWSSTLTGTFAVQGTSTFSDNISLAKTSADVALNIQTNAGQNRSVLFRTGSNPRWGVIVSSATESGSNVGSNLVFNRYDDAGAFLSAALSFARDTGNATFSHNVSISGNLSAGAGTFTGAISPPGGWFLSNYNGDPISSLVGGTTTGGLIAGPANAHVVVQIRANDDGDSFSVVSNSTATPTDPPDTLAFRVNRAGAGRFAGSVQALEFRAGYTGGGLGMVNLARGDASRTGYIEFRNASNVRQGYVGYNNGSTGIVYTTDNVGNHRFAQGVLIQPASGDSSLSIASAAGTSRGVFIQTGSSTRWFVGANTSSESGSNVGSDFSINRYSDAGAYLSAPIFIGRGTGNVALAHNLSVAGGQVSLTHGTANYIDFGSVGVAAPTFTTLSAGTKIALYGGLTGSNAGYNIGIESGAMWLGVATTSNSFKWYGGTTLLAQLAGTGVLTTYGNIVVSQTSASSRIQLQANAAQTRGVIFTTDATARWFVMTNDTAESGSNSGSNLDILRYNDAGSSLGSALSINRATGLTTLTALSVTGDLAVSGSFSSTRQIIAGNGLTGGGDLSADRTLTLGTPTVVNTGSTNSVASTSHTHALVTYEGTARALTTAATSYPSDQVSGGTGDATFPGNISTHLTVRDAGANRVMQFASNVAGGTTLSRAWFRTSHTSSGGGGWSSFREFIFSDNPNFTGVINGTSFYTQAATGEGSPTNQGVTILNLGEWRSANNTFVGAVCFTSPVSPNNCMVQLNIRGLLHGSGIVDTFVQCYVASGTVGSVYWVERGQRKLGVQLSLNAAGNLCVALLRVPGDNLATSWGFWTHLSITSALISHSGSIVSQANRWATSLVTDFSTHTSVVTPTESSSGTSTLTAITPDSSNATRYLNFTDATSGNQVVKAATALTYNPSTQDLLVGGAQGSVLSPSRFRTGTDGGTRGYASVQRGDASRTGYIEFYDAAGVRQGFIGYSNGGGINYQAEVSFNHNFNGIINIASNGFLRSGGGANPPAFTTRSTGTKVVLFDNIGPSNMDYAIGVESSHVWNAVPSNTNSFGFKWYGGTTQIARLDGVGALTLATSLTVPVVNGFTWSVGTDPDSLALHRHLKEYAYLGAEDVNGVYSPTPVGQTNVSSVSTPTLLWSRVGNEIQVRGLIGVAPNGGTFTQVRIPIPVFSARYDGINYDGTGLAISDPASGSGLSQYYGVLSGYDASQVVFTFDAQGETDTIWFQLVYSYRLQRP